MEERIKPEHAENPIPLWIKVLVAVFVVWGIFYLSAFWFPDLARWMQATDPDATQWHNIK